MTTHSGIDFPGSTRVHIALAVTDLERSRAFYEILLGVAPSKIRPGYAKFEPLDPSLNLTLNERDARNPVDRNSTHYGVQVRSTDAVRDALVRFEEAGLAVTVEENTTCCYAVQDKVWVVDPDGNQWEVFVVTEADAENRKDPASGCCTASNAMPAAGACC